MSDGISDAKQANEKLLAIEGAAMDLADALKDCYDPLFGINNAAIREVNQIFKEWKLKVKLIEE